MTRSATRLPRRPALPLTSLTILLLVALPAWWLSRWPRPKAQGLEQLMAAASLLQSFPAMPERRLPQLWRDRLGDQLGSRLWRLQRRTWWQLWGSHADGAPYLVIPKPSVSLGSLVRGSSADRELIQQRGLQVGNLLVLAPDPLAKRLLADELLPRQRPARGLRRQCVERLGVGQAVFWTPTALGALLGPIAPLFQRYQEGCLSLNLAADNRLLWQGVTSSVDGLQAAPPRWNSPRAELPPLDEELLLELRGSALQPLLQGLLSRELIREPLTERYGLERQRLERLERAPFRLRLRPLQQGAFLAGMELQLDLQGSQADWQPVLDRISDTLVEQGLQGAGGQANSSHSSASPTPHAGAASSSRDGTGATGSPAADGVGASVSPAQPVTGGSAGSDGTRAPTAAASSLASTARSGNEPRNTAASVSKNPTPEAGLSLWTRPNGDVLGGWRWIPSRPGSSNLVLFLGASPTPPVALTPLGERPGTTLMLLRLRPRQLAERGLLPAQLPELVRQAWQLQAHGLSRQGKGGDAAFSLLTGQLQVGPR
ncbi:MAG: hypothetical protein VKI42_03235 [Synechococcaceae cyanobacterium]|nr:hypothetical protein [Synechococcaceae cyanobacterium]